jgi:hypothetical protein
MQGRLLTEDFLHEGIRSTVAWQTLAKPERSRLEARLLELFSSFLKHANPNEDATEDELIYPVFEALGWPARLVKQGAARRRTDVPDCLLFADPAAKARAVGEEQEHRRYRYGTSFAEAKRWDRPLDRGSATDRLDPDVPSNQMLRYLSQVEIASEQKILWGILTNGRHWRLYYQRATNRAEEYVEFDLPALLLIPGFESLFSGTPEERADQLACFQLLFRPAAFIDDPDLDGRSFLEYARAEARHWEGRVAENLSQVVFEQLFPLLVQGFIAHDPHRPATLDTAYLEEVRAATLVFLYRLLFVLHAEDRGLLPIDDPRYGSYSLRALRHEIARRRDAGDTFSEHLYRDWGTLRSLFTAISNGDDGLGLPPYNGGLFSDETHSLLVRLRLPDSTLSEVIDTVSRSLGRWINYRDLSVQQLGSIYERLLEYRITAPDGRIPRIEKGVYARRTTGSYYTDESLVQLVIRRTIGPLVAELSKAFAVAIDKESSPRKAPADRLASLAELDPATRLLELRVCDPAMGSGHFLVSLVDYLADRALELASEAAELGKKVGKGAVYESPLLKRTAAIRKRLLREARNHGWPVHEEQLDDRHLVRRIILKRVIYGVDLNPMAVELAKLSLWLHSFTVGAPLSFLDHHLRCGNSLVGSRVADVRQWIETGLFGSGYAGMLQATEMMHRLEELTDSDIAEVKASVNTFGQVEESLEPYRQLLHLDTAHHWLWPTDRKQREHWLDPRTILAGSYGQPLDILANPSLAGRPAVRRAVATALTAAEEERFFHWELMFPEVWYEKGQEKADGGFDAVIGNPPWDRIKLQEVEFFAERRPEIAQSQTAAERQRRIEALRRAGDPLWDDYLKAKEHAERLADYARRCGQYSKLSSGDTNLYALFAERVQSLIHSRGITGLLTPSGIAADKEKADFFGELATSGRIAALLDFENRKKLFPDVDSRQKFCVFVASGSNRFVEATDCAFYLLSADDLADQDRAFQLAPADFARVNPNTRTAPVFRTRRDAEIIRGIYSRLPVLVDHSGSGGSKSPWDIRYFTMFHMTNDSHLFRTRSELEAEGFYPIAGNRWKRGEWEYLPLYEGKMVQMYDHRAASVLVNPKNVHRPGQPKPTTLEQHLDPGWLPEPQFWVPRKEVETSSKASGNNSGWWLGFKDITSPTNQRTMIAAFVPEVGLGNTLPALAMLTARHAALLLACLNSFAFDYVARRKVQGQHLNLYILEQLPVPPPAAFFAQIAKGKTLADFVSERVLRLTYTAHDMAGFARDLGVEGPPFAWDQEERRHWMAQVDALMFSLYGLSLEEADYIVSTFTTIRDQDRDAFGSYRTRDLILAYMRAQAAGDFDSQVDV